MDQSFLEHAATPSTSTTPIFSFASPHSSVLLRALATQQQPSASNLLPSLSALLNSAPMSMSQASLRFQSNPSLSPDPPATGPAVAAAAAMPSTNRLRQQILASAAAQHAVQVQAAAAARRNSRTTGRRGPGPPSAGAATGPSARAAAAAPHASADASEPPRRSTRNRKRAPAAAAAAQEDEHDPPAKKQKRANLKSPPPGSAKSDDSQPEKKEEETIASCCICMDEPKPVDLASINGCDHLFCFECIEKWAERENSCPLCKVRFTKIDRVNKAKKKKGEAAKNTKKVKQKDQRSDIATGAALEGLLASFASSASFPHQRVARLIFSGIGAAGSNPFAVLPGARRTVGVATNRTTSLEDSLFSSDTDEDEEGSFLPGTHTFADFFRAVPRGPGIIVSTGLGRHGISMTLDPPTGRSYASNSGDRTAGRQAENPLEIEDDSEDEEDIEVVQVTRPL